MGISNNYSLHMYILYWNQYDINPPGFHVPCECTINMIILPVYSQAIILPDDDLLWNWRLRTYFWESKYNSIH